MKRADNRLKELREAQGMSLDVLSSRSKVPRNSINRIENGEAELTVDKMRKLGQGLGVAPSALLNDEDVEFRPGAELQPVLDALKPVPQEQMKDVARAAATIVGLAQVFASRSSSAAFRGEEADVMKLASLWNAMGTDERKRALNMIDASGFGDAARLYALR